MKNQLLYLGNRLSKHGLNKTTIETLGLHLEHEDFSVFYASDKKSFPFRMMDMMKAVFQYSFFFYYIVLGTFST